MKITRVSILTGRAHTLEIDVSLTDLARYFVDKLPAQAAFPDLTADEREFIKSGITAEEWATLGDEEED